MAKSLMKGNEVIARAAILAGCRLYFGYPITPQTEISETLAKQMPKVGGLCLQAESEIAAINMVLGAASTGARVLTSSSSPGLSLKSEGVSYLVGSDLPCVIVNVQRGGPGLGGIQPSQADYYQATRAMGHGDMHIIVLAPASIQEIGDLTQDAFDLADTYRTPVMLLSDGAMGQMMEPVDFTDRTPAKLPEKSWAACGTEHKRAPNIVNSLYIQPDELEKMVQERFDRYARIAEKEVRCECFECEDADLVLVSYGITARIAKSAIAVCRKEGIKVGLLRPITLWPFPDKELLRLAERARAFLTLELSMGQMVSDVRLAVEHRRPVYFYGRTGGMMPSVEEVAAEIRRIHKQEGDK